VGIIPEPGVAGPVGAGTGGSDDGDAVSSIGTGASAVVGSRGGEMPGPGASGRSDVAPLVSGETCGSKPGVSVARSEGVEASIGESGVASVSDPGGGVSTGAWGDSFIGCNVETVSAAASPTISRMRSSSSRSGDVVLVACGGTEPAGSGSSARAAAVATSQSMRIAAGGSAGDAWGCDTGVLTGAPGPVVPPVGVGGDVGVPAGTVGGAAPPSIVGDGGEGDALVGTGSPLCPSTADRNSDGAPLASCFVGDGTDAPPSVCRASRIVDAPDGDDVAEDDGNAEPSVGDATTDSLDRRASGLHWERSPPIDNEATRDPEGSVVAGSVGRIELACVVPVCSSASG